MKGPKSPSFFLFSFPCVVHFMPSKDSPTLLFFLLKPRTPFKLTVGLVSLIKGFPLFDLGNLGRRPQHSCSQHHCFSLQGVDQSSYGGR